MTREERLAALQRRASQEGMSPEQITEISGILASRLDTGISTGVGREDDFAHITRIMLDDLAAFRRGLAQQTGMYPSLKAGRREDTPTKDPRPIPTGIYSNTKWAKDRENDSGTLYPSMAETDDTPVTPRDTGLASIYDNSPKLFGKQKAQSADTWTPPPPRKVDQAEEDRKAAVLEEARKALLGEPGEGIDDDEF